MTRFDDWDGFGQRLTGSGTTVFDDVEIHLDDVEIYPNGELPGTHLFAFYQLVHLATLSGIGRRAVADAVEFRARADPQPRQPRLSRRRRTIRRCRRSSAG